VLQTSELESRVQAASDAGSRVPGWSDVLTLMLGHAKWILAGCLLGMIGGLVLALTTPDCYRAEMLVVIHPELQSKTAGRESLSAMLGPASPFPLPSEPSKREALGTLRSNEVLRELMHQDPVFSSRASGTDLLRRIKQSRHVSLNLQTFMITVSIDWTDAETAYRLTSTLVATADNLMRQRTLNASARQIAFLEAQERVATTVAQRQTLNQLKLTYLEFVAKTRTTGNYMLRIVDPVRKPPERVAPQPLLMTIVGAVSGIIGAIFGILVFAPTTIRRQNRISSAKES
jgi:uncharacterized protein involved in exopolysaccharide biosynthesis